MESERPYNPVASQYLKQYNIRTSSRYMHSSPDNFRARGVYKQNNEHVHFENNPDRVKCGYKNDGGIAAD